MTNSIYEKGKEGRNGKQKTINREINLIQTL